ncbi:hypothetical protein CTEN210_18323 [Chaetoceros tenuissimus]|uniref:Uncharacterized protein n=1 Tax=Chaetoceros tenuissimus TaxID=426638 RepID=A0AAD3HFC3_9STRA|nr:hypothetical protein CTEN210_18323 [Chaetoceros tenuissimus]
MIHTTKVKSNRKRSIAVALLAVVGILTLCSPDINTRSLRNQRDELKYKFSEEILKQAADFQKQGVTFNSTIATAFFELPNSNHGIEEYLEWTKNSLCLKDAMVIFTNVPEKLAPLREHAKDRTIIVHMEMSHVEVGNDVHITDEQWEHQNELNNKGKNFNLYKVWAGKSWLVNQAIELNPFNSDVYHWMDIGIFRETDAFCGETVVRHPEIVPEDRMLLFMRRNLWAIDKPEDIVVKDEFASTFITGGWIAGRPNVWPEFLRRFEETVAMYLFTGVSLTEDQALLETTCIRNEGLCGLIVKDNHVGYLDPSEQYEYCDNVEVCKEKAGWRTGMPGGFFAFFNSKYFFYHGGNFKLWDPSTGIPTEDENFSLYHGFSKEETSTKKHYM